LGKSVGKNPRVKFRWKWMLGVQTVEIECRWNWLRIIANREFKCWNFSKLWIIFPHSLLYTIGECLLLIGHVCVLLIYGRTSYVRSLIDGINLQKTWVCTYFHTQRTVSAWQRQCSSCLALGPDITRKFCLRFRCL
jgi:hypothetical protein